MRPERPWFGWTFESSWCCFVRVCSLSPSLGQSSIDPSVLRGYLVHRTHNHKRFSNGEKLTEQGSAGAEACPQCRFRFAEDVRDDKRHELLSHAVISLELRSWRFLWEESSLASGRVKHRENQPNQARTEQTNIRSSRRHVVMITKSDTCHQGVNLRTRTGRSSRSPGRSPAPFSKSVTTSRESGSPS